MKQIPSNIFRGYDIRGIYNKELDEDTFEKIGKAYGTFLSQRKINESVVGFDARTSSESLAKAFIKGLRSTGINIIDIGLTLTQIMYFAQYHYLSKGGAIITASHNPAEYNGLKLAAGFSDTLISEEIQEIREIAQNENFVTNKSEGDYRKDDVFPAYQDYLQKILPLNINKKVVVDSMNATTGKFLPQILRNAGCEVIEENTTIDGTFPLGTPDPTESEVLERLAESVKQNNADLGFSYDSDGDRVGIVDHEGNSIWNDVLVAIFAKEIIINNPKTPIVFNTLCSRAVTEVIEEAGGKPVIWKTGHSFIKAKVREERSLFGGELSGHFFFMDNFFGHDDGANASLRLLEILQNNNSTLKEESDKIPYYFSSPEIKVGCSDDTKFEVVSTKVGDALKKQFPNADYIEIDGVRADWEDNMIIVRASQNGPYITIKFESKTEEGYQSNKKIINDILQAIPEINFEEGVNTAALE